MNIVGKIKLFLFPDIEPIKNIKEFIQQQMATSCQSKQKIDGMIATLNGEDNWFLRRVNKEGYDGQ